MRTDFYERLCVSRQDNESLASCIERVVNQLERVSTTSDRPGMLLGKIQSGKTRAFIGVIARAFDLAFDMAVVLTKGTRTLSEQTVARISGDLKPFIADDEVLVLDIMRLPGRLTKGELRRKMVLVAKKQAANLRRVLEFFRETYPDLCKRRIVLIDDEADLASVRFVKADGGPDIEQGRIAGQMDELRRLVDRIAFLQVTATPYSLYLQPAEYEAGAGEFVFKPKKPSFTELLPIHESYVGGDDYFGSFDETDPRRYLFAEVAQEEQESLRREDQRRIRSDRILDTPNTVGLRRAILTFILAVCIRRWQQEQGGEKKQKYAMIIHNDTQKQAHAWQERVVGWILNAIVAAADSDLPRLRLLFDDAYSDLARSVGADGGRMPDADQAFTAFVDALRSQDVVIEKVNSDREVLNLLDEKAELKLRTAFNIYLGGNILDRGITIPNLIAFYYGRNPKTMQADTVLQHSRMYGMRNRRDLAVTRFYSSQDVYDRLYKIHTFETALREAFENGAHDRGVVFVQSDPARRVRPCAPNKILLSEVVAVRPSGLFLPTGFRTQPARILAPAMKTLDRLIPKSWRDTGRFVEVDRMVAFEIISAIEETLRFDEEPFEWDAMRGLLDYYSAVRTEGEGKVLLIAATGRQLSREKSGDKSGLSIIGTGLRAVVVDSSRSKPALVLIQQEGTEDLGWSGHRFWWPILAAPSTVEPCVFATKVPSDMPP